MPGGVHPARVDDGATAPYWWNIGSCRAVRAVWRTANRRRQGSVHLTRSTVATVSGHRRAQRSIATAAVLVALTVVVTGDPGTWRGRSTGVRIRTVTSRRSADTRTDERASLG